MKSEKRGRVGEDVSERECGDVCKVGEESMIALRGERPARAERQRGGKGKESDTSLHWCLYC